MKLLTQFSGVVLTGGSSSRMGADKALVRVPGPPPAGAPADGPGGPPPDELLGVPLVEVAVRALRGAGAHDVTCIGGDQAALEALGFAWWPDEHPREGPLGGLVTGLRAAALPIVVVLTCDLPRIDPASVRGLVDALDRAPDAMAAMPELRGRRQVLTAAYRRIALGPLDAAFATGERSVRRALADVPVTVVTHLDPGSLADVDSPEDLDRYAQGVTDTPAPSTGPGDRPARGAGGPEPDAPGPDARGPDGRGPDGGRPSGHR